MYKHIFFTGLFLFNLLIGCTPGLPVTSVITIDADGLTVPVNKNLYGITLEEINHAIDGGLYAEMIQNRSFEDGIPPLHCAYNSSRNVITTPNGWSIPFIRPDSVPGWRLLTSSTSMWPDNRFPMSEFNRRSLLVSVNAVPENGRGGILAEGYKGLSVRKGRQYTLSLYVKCATTYPKEIKIALEDSVQETRLSDIFQVSPSYDWKLYRHTFTATADTDQAVLTITTEEPFMFWIDMVSLFPVNTWKERPNGVRADLMEKIMALHPAFVRFPGGAFVEGYTGGTFPVWRETIGEVANRRSFWNIWGYGSSNGMGFHEFLQVCEDLKAEAVYVVNSGVTSQSRRPRYEDITAMNKLVQEALDAIAYANDSTDTELGRLRAHNGHPEPFHLKYIEIGSENYGYKYARRFNYFKNAVQEVYPDIQVIGSSPTRRTTQLDWVDSHFYTSEEFFLSGYNRYVTERFNQRHPAVFIGEYSLADPSLQGTLRAAIAEACFLVGIENSQDVVKRVAYAPLLGNADYPYQRFPAIAFKNGSMIGSPSYYLLQLLGNNRGDEVLKTEVQTYRKPLVVPGRVSVELFDNSYEITEVSINQKPVASYPVKLLSGDWQILHDQLIPAANKWNYVMLGDTTSYNYSFSAKVKRVKGSGSIQLRIRDNGKKGEEANHIGLEFGSGSLEFYRQSGSVKDTLATPVSFSVENNKTYSIRLESKDEEVYCYINDSICYKAVLPHIPSIVSSATLDQETNSIIIKVVNTTLHT
ncbi:MAG: carbohydrate binding domain-containing protein, partial [Tannerellaceae bacterium]|nr:carbohydrate binding domain-containing protein [Tannerellaceae bacterium]